MINTNYDGPLKPRTLVPLYGNSYKDLDAYSKILILANDWKYKDFEEELAVLRNNQVVDKYTRDISYMLEAEILINRGYYAEALAVMTDFLQTYPDDIQALFLSACVSYKLLDSDMYHEFCQRLKENSPYHYGELNRIIQLMEQNQRRTDFEITENDIMAIDAVVLYGNRMEEDGTMSHALHTRLLEAIRILKMNDKAMLLASGGAAVTPYSEADAMWSWLEDKGISKNRIFMDEDAKDTVGNNFGFQMLLDKYDLNFKNYCVVSSLSHLPRVWMSFTESMNSFNRKYDQIFASSYEPSGSIEIPDDELDYGLFTILRSAQLFERKDFE